MAIYQPESFYSTTLASAVTAGQTTIPVITAPNITSGYLVLESANSTNREIILYTGVSGTTLTGVTRGLAFFGSNPTAGTGIAHAAGVDISNKDVHYYFSQFYDFLTGVSATGYNTMKIGDSGASSATNRVWNVALSAYTPFWGLSSNGKMVVSEDGTTSYVISAGGSGVTAGTSIDITAGAVSVTKLSTGGLTTSAGKLVVGLSSLIARDATGIRVDTTSAMQWSGLQGFQAMTATSATFSNSISVSGQAYGVNTQLFVADEAIAVSVNPKPVKLTSAGRVYMVSSGVSGVNSHPFIGWAVTAAAAAGNNVYVQTDGVIPGFTGLMPTSAYYAVSGAGVFAVNWSTNEIQVGVAKSATEMIMKRNSGEYLYSEAWSGTSTTTTMPKLANTAVIVASPSDGSHTVSGVIIIKRNGQLTGSIGGASGAGQVSESATLDASGTTITYTQSSGGTPAASGTTYYYT